jgi:hypothetical protein
MEGFDVELDRETIHRLNQVSRRDD